MPVTSSPSRTRRVMPLNAASVVLPSKHSPGPSPYMGWKWSKPQTPWKPRSSANRARSATSDHGTRCCAMSSPKRTMWSSRDAVAGDPLRPRSPGATVCRREDRRGASRGCQTRTVHFEREHDFGASPARVGALMCDPEFQRRLELPDLSLPTVVVHDVDGAQRVLRLRYRYTGQLDSLARRVIGNRELTWVQELRLDVEHGSGALSFSADDDAGRVDGTASVTISPTGADGSHRRIAGDFHIRIPLVGGTAERKIVPGIVRRLDVEAAALAARLTSGD